MQESYKLIDRSERTHKSFENVSDFSLDSNLGRDIEIIMLIKWNDQRQRDDGMRALATASLKTEQQKRGPERKFGYFGGFIVKAALNHGTLWPEDVLAWPVIRPTGIGHMDHGRVAYACGNKLIIAREGNPTDISSTIENEMFARLHSAAISNDSQRILTASSSLDMLYEVNSSDGSIEWSMDIWSQTPYNSNPLGQSFYRKVGKTGIKYHVNPSCHELEESQELSNASCVIDDPKSYDQLGLTTSLTPVFINSLDYESDDVLLATSFGKGEAWRIDRQKKQIEVAGSELGRPHGFHVNSSTGGYIISDTRKEHVLFLNETLDRETSFDLSNIEGKKRGLENHRWLQYTTELNTNTYCAIMSSRQSLVLFNPVARTRRTINFHPDWGVQMAILDSKKKPIV